MTGVWRFCTGIFTARKRSLGQGNVFTGVCQSFCPHASGSWGGHVSASGSGVVIILNTHLLKHTKNYKLLHYTCTLQESIARWQILINYRCQQGCLPLGQGVSASGSRGCAHPGHTHTHTHRHAYPWTPPDTYPTPDTHSPLWSTNGRYASYWNSILLMKVIAAHTRTD